jgi:tetraacyldisaccharide 4'-kinase
MRTPDFWYRPPHGMAGAAARLLTPFGLLYDAVGILRRALVRPADAGIPVVCVGNLVAGGAGKTPVALAVAALIAECAPHFLTRGYGGSLAGPVRVDPAQHSAAEVGDEALLLAAAAPTWVAHDRVAGARAAAAAGAGCIVMDDGFQNPSLKKDIGLVVIDGASGFGNGRLIPAGPLRETPVHALKRAQAIVMIGDDATRLAGRLPATLPVFAASLVATPDGAALAGKRVYAFAGIGRPQKFFDTLAGLGCEMVVARGFADHHLYSREEIDEIVSEAASRGAVPVTTAKDAARLAPGQRRQVQVLDIVLEWQGEAAIRRLLSSIRRVVPAGRL